MKIGNEGDIYGFSWLFGEILNSICPTKTWVFAMVAWPKGCFCCLGGPLWNGSILRKEVPALDHQSSDSSNGNTVDGRNPKQPPGMYKTHVNNGINYQPQQVSRISSISSRGTYTFLAYPWQKPSLKLTATAPENGWLDPFGMAYFQVRTVSFRECT